MVQHALNTDNHCRLVFHTLPQDKTTMHENSSQKSQRADR